MGYRLLERWLTAESLDQCCRCRVDTVSGMHVAARAGLGLAALPCYLGDADDALVQVGEPVAALSTDLWLLTHPDLRGSARVRVLLDFVADRIRMDGNGLAPPG